MAQPTQAKVAIVAVAILVAVAASPVLVPVAGLALIVALVGLSVQAIRRRPVRSWGFALVGVVVALIILSGSSSAIYGTGGSSEVAQQEVSTPEPSPQQKEPSNEAKKLKEEYTAWKAQQEKEEQAAAPKKKKTKPELKPSPSVAEQKPKEKSGSQNTVLVTEVVDGDTIDISPAVHGEDRVRLIGVDTPEVHGGEESCGQEASAFTTDVLEGERVRLEFDEDLFDPYDRLLAYVYLQDGRMFNEMLVEVGYASVATYPQTTDMSSASSPQSAQQLSPHAPPRQAPPQPPRQPQQPQQLPSLIAEEENWMRDSTTALTM